MSDEKVKRPEGVTQQALAACANWLNCCLEIGWKKSDLDALEQLWWDHHDRTGTYVQSKAESPT